LSELRYAARQWGCRIILKEEEMHVAGVGERLCAYLLLLFGEVVASVAACREGEIGKRAVGHLFFDKRCPFFEQLLP